MPPLGLSRMGFISGTGSSPHASACTTCARAISPPLKSAAPLFDMFCALNGATRTPWLRSQAHTAVVIQLLPALEDVPRMERAFIGRRVAGNVPETRRSKLDPRLRLHPGVKWMLDLAHLGDEVRRRDQRLGRAAPGADHVQALVPRRDVREHFGERQVIVGEHHVELVEQEETELRVAQVATHDLPAGAAAGNVGGAVLRLPSEA